MFDIHLNAADPAPLYLQIADQIKQHVARGMLSPGERLPTVRSLAVLLNVNTGTVMRAYRDLEREHVITTRHGGGTEVADLGKDSAVERFREERLARLAGDAVVEALSLGYSPEDLEAAFHLHLARWRDERNRASVQAASVPPQDGNSLQIVASHDLALDLLVSHLRQKSAMAISVSYAGSLGGLIALQQGRARLAGIHLLDEETGEYNYPYIKRLLPGRKTAVLHLAWRIQGLMYDPKSPHKPSGLQDLRGAALRFVNRQQGSGTRVLFDLNLRRQGIPTSEIQGYEKEVDTHLAAAELVARGEADVALSIEAAATAYHLTFVPLFKERYDLVMSAADYSGFLAPLAALISSDGFKKTIREVPGYDTSETGAVTFCQ